MAAATTVWSLKFSWRLCNIIHTRPHQTSIKLRSEVSVLSYQFPFPKVLKTDLIQCIFKAIVGRKFCDLWVCDKIKISPTKPAWDKIYIQMESKKYFHVKVVEKGHGNNSGDS